MLTETAVMRSAKKCVVSAVLVKANELPKTVLSRVIVRSRTCLFTVSNQCGLLGCF